MEENEHTDELASLEHTYKSIAGQTKNGKKKRGCCGVLLLVFLFVLIGFMAFCFWGNTHGIPSPREQMPYSIPQ